MVIERKLLGSVYVLTTNTELRLRNLQKVGGESDGDGVLQVACRHRHSSLASGRVDLLVVPV